MNCLKICSPCLHECVLSTHNAWNKKTNTERFRAVAGLIASITGILLTIGIVGLLFLAAGSGMAEATSHWWKTVVLPAAIATGGCFTICIGSLIGIYISNVIDRYREHKKENENKAARTTYEAKL